MKIFFTLILTFILSATVNASDLQLNNLSLNDQFAITTTIDESIKWVLFANDMDGYKLAKEVLEAEKIDDIKAKGGAFVADISKMPTLIYKMFALPKMKKLKFKILLDQDGDITKSWPRKEKELTLMKLESGKVTQTSYLKTESDLKAFLKN